MLDWGQGWHNLPPEGAIKDTTLVFGSDPRHGPVGGIHWHMNVANKIEYIATDEQRQVTPWIRMTDERDVVREYSTPTFRMDSTNHVIRTMDCMDCHNRPSSFNTRVVISETSRAMNVILQATRKRSQS